MKYLKTLLLLLAVAAVLGLPGLLHNQYPRLLAVYWRSQLDSVSDQKARELLGQIGALDESGVAVLVEALGSPRESVARAASQVLTERMELWTTLPPREASPRLLVLAKALAERVPQFGPTARRDAEDVATWILRWRPDGEIVDRAELIALCEKVLEATSFRQPEEWPEGRITRHEPVADKPPGPGFQPGGDRPRPQRDLPLTTSIAALARLPGGGLPVDEPAATTENSEPPRLLDGQAERDLTASNTLVSDPRPNQGLRLTPASPKTAGPGTSAIAGSTVEHRPPTLLPAVNSVDDLAQRDSLELMRLLRTSGGDTTLRIRAELARRGFTEVHMELARRMFDPDPQVRIALARALPGLKTVDATNWLLWLSEDENAEVRLAAITLLATTGDPNLLRRVQAIAAKDRDARIRRQGARVALRPGESRQH